MHICASTKTVKRFLGSLGQAVPKLLFRNFDGSDRRLSPSRSVLVWIVIVSTSLFLAVGCGRYKEELESAKQQVQKLDSEVKKLSEEVAGLNQHNTRLSGDVKNLSEKNAQIQQELNQANQARAALSGENKEMQKKSKAADEEISTLKREKANLTKEVDELKKQAAEMIPSQKSPGSLMPQARPQSKQQLEKLNPCDAVLAFMKACEGIVRQQRGPDRTRSLEQLKQLYGPRMQGAPERAIKASEDWVKEAGKLWDESASYSSASTLRILELRNVVLEACGKLPGEAGF